MMKKVLNVFSIAFLASCLILGRANAQINPGGGGGSGSVSVTAADGSIVINPSPGTGTFTVQAPELSGNTLTSGNLCTTNGSIINCNITALPNGITATSQSAGDNTTKVATDAFVTTAVANAVAGVNPAVAVQAATTQASDTSGLTYNNGVSGVGATFTGSVNTALIVDGFTFTALGQRLLIKNDTQSPSGAFNGIYNVTQVQTGILPPILTRALDYDQPSDMNNTGAIPVVNGTVNATTSWLLTSAINTVGTDPLAFTKFSNSPTAPTPLSSGTSISLTAPRQYFVCTTTCTITPPVPAAGYEFCVMNGDNISTVITMAAIGSSAQYEKTARTGYGTAGTGTFISGGAIGDKVCILGLDATHYLTTTFTGSWTAS